MKRKSKLRRVFSLAISFVLLTMLLLPGYSLAEDAGEAVDSTLMLISPTSDDTATPYLISEEPTLYKISIPKECEPGSYPWTGIDDSGSKPPVIEEPVTEEPVTEEPVTEEPVTEEPVTEGSVTEEPVTEEPVTEEPVTEEPGTEDPSTENPVIDEPVKEDGDADKPVDSGDGSDEPSTFYPCPVYSTGGGAPGGGYELPEGCENGECLRNFKTTWNADNTLALADETSDSSSTDTSAESAAFQAAPASAEDESAEATDQEARAFSVTAMPKTGVGGTATDYTMYGALALMLLLIGTVIYRKRQQ